MESLLIDNPYLFEYFGTVLILLIMFGIASQAESLTALKALLGVALMLVPIGYFYAILSAHAVNVPYTDDFVLLETVQKFREAPNFLEATKVLFEQVNQHRFAFERLVMLAMVSLTGTIDIKVQILLGNLFLLGILYLFFRAFRKEGVSWYYFIPVPYLLFNLVYYENANWGIAAIQNTPLIFFAFLTFYGLNKGSTKWLVASLLTAVVTTFISGTGMLTLLIGALLLVFQQRYKFLLVWVACTAGAILFYFLFDYTFIDSKAESLWTHPIYNGLLLLGFWGNALYLDIPHPLYPAFYPDMVACAILGLGIGLVFLAWILRFFLVSEKNRSSYWFLVGAFLFMLGTGAMFVLSRPLDTYFMYGGSIFSRRYMLFGVVLAGLAYLSLVIMGKRNHYYQTSVALLGIAAFVLLNFQSYFSSIVQLRKQREELLVDAYYWKNYTTFLTAGNNFGDIPFWNHPTRMKELVRSVETGGLSNLLASDRFPASGQLHTQAINDTMVFGGRFFVKSTIRNNDANLPAEYLHFYAAADSTFQPSHFLLASQKHTLLLPAIPVVNSWADFIEKRTYYSSLYHYGLYRTKMPAGKFGSWVLADAPDTPGRWEAWATRNTVTLTDQKRSVAQVQTP
jgi:hypothetical protein